MGRQLRMWLAVVAAAWTARANAQTVPQWITYEGQLLTTSGVAAPGSHSIVFSLWTAASGGSSAAWSDTLSVQVDNNGLYSATLGTTSGDGFPAGLFNGQALYLELTVDGDLLSPRQAVGSVGYAITAGALQGGPVNATSIAVNGTTIVNSNGTLASGVAGPLSDLCLDLEFNEASGSTFADSSPAGYTATGSAGGIAAGSLGHSGNAVSFTGGYVTISSGIPDSPAVWVEAWIQPQAPLTGTKVIVSRTPEWQLLQIGTEVSFQVNGTTGANPVVATTNGASLAAGTWTHVAGWYDGLYATVSVNGLLTTRVSAPNGPIEATGAALWVGSVDSANPFTGAIDEVRIRQNAAPVAHPFQSTYVEWGATSCHDPLASTIGSGTAFANYATHGGASPPVCLANGTAAGPVNAAQNGDSNYLYVLTIQGGQAQQPSATIVNTSVVECARCATPEGACFVQEGSQACPTGFTANYDGYLYGNYYANQGIGRVCIDSTNFADTAQSTGTANFADLYPSVVADNNGTPVNIDANAYVDCAVCCATF